MTSEPGPLSRTGIENQFIETYRDLLPHSVQNVFMPLDTPLRWFEAWYVNDSAPRAISLWSAFNDHRVDLTRNFHPDSTNTRGEWNLGIRDYSEFDKTGRYNSTSIIIPLKGAVEVEFATYKSGDRSEIGYFEEGVWDFNIGQKRRKEVIETAQDVLNQSQAECPPLQQAFLEELGMDETDRGARSIVNLGSPATKTALESVGLEF